MERARRFMLCHARPVDWARWRFHFEGGSAADVLDALSAYQNTDGGFGHGLEADCWNPASSPIQTWCATAILREIGWTDAAHPIMQGIVRYLMSGDAFNGRGWQYEIASNADYPHAPWWEMPAAGVTVNDNPTASLAGFLVRFGEGESRALGERLAEEAIDRLMSAEVMEMHTLACFLDLQEDLAAVGDHRARTMAAQLAVLAEACVCRDADRWYTSYCCKPSNLLRSRDSTLYPHLAALAAEECRVLAACREPDGAWSVTWDWHAYPESWSVAKTWWKGDICVKNMLFIRRFAE